MSRTMPSKPDPTRPETGEHNLRPRNVSVMHPDEAWHLSHWYERPREDPALPEVYVYTDAMSYAPGEEVRFHASCNGATWSLQVWRDGLRPQLVHEAADLPGAFHPTPARAYAEGCGWPAAHSWRVPEEAASGFYRVASWTVRPDGSRFLQHAFFVVRPAREAPKDGRFLLILCTSTWIAYNDWGGSNAYDGIDGSNGDRFSPVLSTQRPWTRGLLWLPPGAPRLCDPVPRGPWEAPRYPTKEFAFTNGFAQYYAAAGWAQFERHFVEWAEREGFAFDMITQHDLHFRPELLHGYPCVCIVGHDEYWTREMRQTVERFAEQGGGVARFGGNFYWQIRLEDEGRRQVAYKSRARAEDPSEPALRTGPWEDPEINWPGAATFGVNGMRGVYASWGGFTPRGARGFTVYRPRHWCFDGLDMHYGDLLGHEAGVFAYEVDGLEYGFREGVPFPTGEDGAPDGVEIIALSPAVLGEEMHEGEGFRYSLKEGGAAGKARLLAGDDRPETVERRRRGCGVVVSMPRGRGEVFCAGSAEWVTGLIRRDFYVEGVTRNVLDRFTRR